MTSASAVRVSVYERPAEALPWRVRAFNGVRSDLYRLNTEQEARDLAARIAEHN